MSFRNKGSMPVTVTVSRLPDRSGNFVCDGTADDVQIQAAIDYVTALGGGKVFVRKGQYICLNALLINTDYITLEGDVAGYLNFSTELRTRSLDATINVGQTGGASRNGVKIANFFINPWTAGAIAASSGIKTYNMNSGIIENIRVRHCNGASGIELKEGSSSNLITRIHTLSCLNGIFVEFGNNNIFVGCNLYGDGAIANDIGIRIEHPGGEPETISDTNKFYGIQCAGSDYGVFLQGGWYNEFYGLRTENIGIRNVLIQDAAHRNKFFGGTLFDVETEAGADENQFIGTTIDAFIDNGTDTRLPTKTFQFIQGTTFISADGSAKGWEINAEADMAVALGQLPPEVQQVIRIKIWAVALGAPAGAGGYMHLDVLFNAGGSLEDYNLAANSWTLANFNGEEADYANNKVVHWVIEDGDVGNELSNLLGGDSFALKINGGTAAGDDGATNATFRAVEVEYV